jgi:hypothetical protein
MFHITLRGTSLVCRKGSEDGDGEMMSVIRLRAEKAPLVFVGLKVG